MLLLAHPYPLQNLLPKNNFNMKNDEHCRKLPNYLFITLIAKSDLR